MFDFSIVTQWVHSLLTSFMPEELAVLIECIVIGVCIMLAYAVIAIIMIFMERKVCAAFQCRLGPMRVGPQGTIQVFADVFKMLIKEIITIRHADKFLYNLAPYIVILASIMAFSCLPINKGMEVLDFNVGIFFLLAASSIGVVGILLAGWSSNNKYSLIGAMRSGAQMISYELSVGLSILTIVILTDTMQLSEIVERQADGWFLFKGHIPALIAFIIYLIAGNAEVNRGPFDLPEAESELTAGYHTEYSGMHFGLFYVAEFVNLFIIAAVATTIFLGGWMPLHIPGLDGFNAIFGLAPRIAAASFVAFIVGSFANAYVMSVMKIRDGGKHFSARAIWSTVAGESCDSLIFFPLALGGIVPTSELPWLMLWQVVLKTVYEIIVLPITIRVVNAIKKHEGEDVYDNNISYNIFKLGAI